jgi:hypothetical protein
MLVQGDKFMIYGARIARHIIAVEIIPVSFYKWNL